MTISKVISEPKKKFTTFENLTTHKYNDQLPRSEPDSPLLLYTSSTLESLVQQKADSQKEIINAGLNRRGYHSQLTQDQEDMNTNSAGSAMSPLLLDTG